MGKKEECRYCGAEYIKEHSRTYFCSWQCRFKSNIPVDRIEDECWEWPLSRNIKTGYGQFNIRSKPITIDYAHRISFSLYSGKDIPCGMFVLHKCDNRCCFNPKHLFLGTQIDNIADMSAKNRNKFGVDHHNAKLDPDKVRYIRSSGKTQKALASELGVSAGVISQVIRGLIWRRVE